jgi:ABC-type Fe3+-hydroxamate transport system substrate-binding protein
MTSEILVALGAQETLVGAAPLVDGGPEVVAACANVPKVGGLESIALAKPDLVVAYAIVERSEPHLFAALRDQGIEVRIFDPQTPEEIIETIRELGQLSGRAQVAQRLVADFAARLNALAGLLHGKRYFVFDCCDPPLSAGRRSSLASALQHAGAVNIFADLDVQWSRVAWEEVWRRRPEFIILTDYEASSTAAKRLVLRRDPVLAELPIVTLNLREALAGPQLIHGIEKVVATIGGPA